MPSRHSPFLSAWRFRFVESEQVFGAVDFMLRAQIADHEKPLGRKRVGDSRSAYRRAPNSESLGKNRPPHRVTDLLGCCHDT